LQERKEQLQKVIKRSLATKADAQKEICRAFNNQASSFLTLKLIKDAYDILVKLKISGSDIPSITDKTIQYLIDHGECLCGRHLPPESVELEYIKKWFDVLPPKSIGNMVNDFKMTARNRIGSLNDFIDVRDGKLARISECDEEILNAEDEIQSTIDSKLNGIDVEEIVRTISSTIAECERCINRDNQEIRELSEKIGAEKAKKESAELRLKEHALKSKTNRKIEIYKAYAMRINQLLSDTILPYPVHLNTEFSLVFPL
jgi:DNA sulfur modification protein DndD